MANLREVWPAVRRLALCCGDWCGLVSTVVEVI